MLAGHDSPSPCLAAVGRAPRHDRRWDRGDRVPDVLHHAVQTAEGMGDGAGPASSGGRSAGHDDRRCPFRCAGDSSRDAIAPLVVASGCDRGTGTHRPGHLVRPPEPLRMDVQSARFAALCGCRQGEIRQSGRRGDGGGDRWRSGRVSNQADRYHHVVNDVIGRKPIVATY